MKTEQQRDFGLDLARCAAVLLVLSVHSFQNNGFYTEPLAGKSMFLALTVRMACMTCVPLFMLLTGWLCIGRKWEKGYYRKLLPILFTYGLSGLACLLFRTLRLGQEMTWRSFLRSFTDFSAAPYAWYIEMYIGLFLLSPFFNAAWHAVDKKGRAALTLSLIALTSVSPVLNSFTGLWPDWWEAIYPLTYYAVGAWLREHPLRVKKRRLLPGWVGTAAAAAAWSWTACRGEPFVWTNTFNWQSPFFLLQAVLLFSALRQCDGSRTPAPARWCVGRVAKLSLSMYLVSYIADQLIYPPLNRLCPSVHLRIFRMPVDVALVALCSCLIAQPVDWATDALMRLVPKPNCSKKAEDHL